MMTRYIFLLCLVALSGCSAVPVAQRQDVATFLPGAFYSHNATQSENSLLWNDSFSDEQLQADIQTLKFKNFDLEAARSRVKQAAAAYGISRGDLFPELEVSTDFESSREKKDGGNSVTTSDIIFGAALNWELDIWGRLRTKKKSASLSFEEQIALKDQTALDLQTLLVENWIKYHASRNLEEVLLAQQETNQQFLDLTELRLSQGQGNALNVLQQRRRLAVTKRELPTVTANKAGSANAYAVLLGKMPANTRHAGVEAKRSPVGGVAGAARLRPAGANNIFTETKDLPELQQFHFLPTPQALMESRPDLWAAFLSLLAADQDVAAAIANRLPRLSIGLSYNIAASALSNIGGNQSLSFTSGLLAPIFDAGKRKAEVSRQKARAEEALADLNQAMLIAVQEIEDGLALEQALFEEQRLIKNEITIAQETVAKAKLRYVNGQENYLSVLDALENLQTLRKQEILLKRDLLINRSKLLKAFGAKWSLDYEEN
jgi:outer membrane protein TolC